MRVLYILLFLLFISNYGYSGSDLEFAVATAPIPVFNSAEAAFSPADLKPDLCGQIRELEFIALKGTVFKIVGSLKDFPLVYEISTDEYPAPDGVRLYLSVRDLELEKIRVKERTPAYPEREQVVKRLKASIGRPYIWGGNLSKGVFIQKQICMFAGLDCSGMLYEATEGYTPRNTAQLVSFGKPLPISGLEAAEIEKMLRPLDLLVWKGHVLVVLDSKTFVESVIDCRKKGGGVVISPIKKRLRQIMKERAPADNWPEYNNKARIFVIRRWL